MNKSSGGLEAAGASLRAIAQVLEAEAAAPSMPPAAPEIDYSELNYKNLEDAAAALGICVPLMREIVHREDFPGYKIGTRWVIPKAELAEWNAKAAKEKAEFDL